jgi:M6 family metalloprotease-like protein
LKLRLILLILMAAWADADASHPIVPLMPPVEARAHALDEPWPNADSIRICALRVEFQPDVLTGTSGTGLMGDSSIFPGTLYLDPLPHGRKYFTDHLAFIEDFYRTASHDCVRFAQPAIFPADDDTVLRLNYPMWHYNYNTGQDQLNAKLIELFVHAIWKADSAGIPLQLYNAFVIFHAGVGKDFNFGYDATPFDIPSAYISAADLEPYRAQLPPSVTRGLILPEGENQQEALDYGIELSLNGISVKLFGNWLGLPDLFDTHTGRSGIGRWGTMDQGSGNLNALVPALPDAWSRVYMGWSTPAVVVPGGDTAVATMTHQIARLGSGANLPEIIKIPVTPREYYLIENRDADADSIGHVSVFDRDGRELQMDRDGNIAIQQDFRVAVRANHYDYGIPGSGILIWHIDEDVIDAGLPTNSVNADREHRGVDLVEADGAQDIGREYGFATSGSGTELGIQADAWWGSNVDHKSANGGAPVRFTDRTHPSSRLYDGSYTYLELTSFSDVADTMSFRVRLTFVEPGWPVSISSGTPPQIAYADYDGDGFREMTVQTGSVLSVYSHAGELAYRGEIPAEISIADWTPTGMDIDGDGAEELPFVGALAAYFHRADDGTYAWVHGSYHPNLDGRLIPCLTADSTHLLIELQYPAADSAWLALYTPEMELIDRVAFAAADGNAALQNIESLPAEHFALALADSVHYIEVSATGISQIWSAGERYPQVTVLAEPDARFVYVFGRGYLRAQDGVLIASSDTCGQPEGDWDGDGIPDNGGRYGSTRARVEDKPTVSASLPSIWDFDADGKPDLMGLDEFSTLPGGQNVYSRIQISQHSGQSFSGLPLAAHDVLADCRYGLDLAPDNNLFFTTVYLDSAANTYAISLNKLPVLARNGVRFKYTEPVGIYNVGALRPQVHDRADWVYCWPNPAAETSFIRLTRSVPSRAAVKIFDLAGRKVAELRGSSNIAGPFEIPWDVRAVESGVYIATVEVSDGTATERKELKIAVVK